MPTPVFVPERFKKQWEKAKDIVRDYLEEHGTENLRSIWALVHKVYLDVGGKNKGNILAKEEVVAVTPESLSHSDPLWESVKNKVFTSEKYKNLTNEERYQFTEALYENLESPELNEEKLNEFVNSWGGLSFGASSYGGTTIGGISNLSVGGYGGGAGLGSGGFGLGGYRDEKPIGPIVYGMDSGLGRRSNSRKDPAVVVIPRKIQPPPYEGFDQDVQDLKRAQNVASPEVTEDKLEGILEKLEEIGINVDSLNSMSEEQIEDTVNDAIQKYKAKNKPLTESKSYKEKLNEIFTYEGVLDEDKRKDGPIIQARRILAKKMQKKEVYKKDKEGKYLIQGDKIEGLMDTNGYKFDPEDYKWVKKDGKDDDEEKDPNKKYVGHAPEVSPSVSYHDKENQLPIGPKPIERQPTQASTPSTQELMKSYKDLIVDKEDRFVDPVTREKMKVLEARFILGFAHSIIDATHYDVDPTTDIKTPKMPDQEILDKMTMLEYQWNPDKLIWFDINNSLPSIIFEKHESIKSIIGRAYLSARGNVDPISTPERGIAKIPQEEIDIIMDKKGFTFNHKTTQWQKKEKEIKEMLTEAVQYGYNKQNALDMQALYLITPALVDAMAQGGYNTTQIESEYKKLRISDPNPDIDKIEEILTKLDYKPGNINDTKPVWKDDDGSSPKVLKYDNEESLIARGILASSQKDKEAGKDFVRYRIDFSPKKTPADILKEIKPTTKTGAIIGDMEQNGFTWNANSGWVKSTGEADEKDQAEAQKENEENIVQNWINENVSPTQYKDADKTIQRKYQVVRAIEQGLLKDKNLKTYDIVKKDSKLSDGQIRAYAREASGGYLHPTRKFVEDYRSVASGKDSYRYSWVPIPEKERGSFWKSTKLWTGRLLRVAKKIKGALQTIGKST